MGKYIITFVKNLLSSDGHPFKVLQRTTSVHSHNADEALRIAQRQFERLENVPDWHLHADFIEMSAERGKHQKKVA